MIEGDNKGSIRGAYMLLLTLTLTDEKVIP